MKLVISRQDMMRKSTIAVLSHDEMELEWKITVLDKKTNYESNEFGDFDVFEQINAYWAYLPKEQQDKIFNVYVRIKETFESVWALDPLISALYKLVQELYRYHDLKDIRHWMDFHSGMGMPVGLRESFKESHETPGTRERTYLKEDYRWLMALTLALRPMVPIWGEFIHRTEKEVGTAFKEFQAFRLLAYAGIMNSEPMERLRNYVTASLPADKNSGTQRYPAAILGGISTEDFPIWMLGLIVVRRLSIVDLRGINPDYMIVTLIYHFINYKTKSNDNSFVGMVKNKTVEGQAQEGENNLSKLEGYKIKQEIPAGDIVTMAFYMQDLIGVAQRIAPDIDLRLLEISVQSVRAMEKEQIRAPQITLMQWVLKSAIPPRGLMHLNKQSILNAMAVTQAILWHRKHHELAALVSAIAQENTDMMQLSGATSRARLPKETVETLNQLYPFARIPPGKQKTGLVEKQTNPAVVAITNMDKAFSEHDWRLTLPNDWVAIVNQNKNTRRYYVPHDIKIKLADLAIALARRTF